MHVLFRPVGENKPLRKPFTRKRSILMIDPGINGKVALITGANSPYGIGAAAARAFARQGAAVFITYLRQRVDLSPQAAVPDAAAIPGEAFYQAAQQLTAEAVVEEIRAAGGLVA